MVISAYRVCTQGALTRLAGRHAYPATYVIIQVDCLLSSPRRPDLRLCFPPAWTHMICT